MTNNQEKLKVLSEQAEYGIEEFGRDNEVNIDVTTVWKMRGVKLPDHVMLFQAFSMFAAGEFQPATCKILFKLLSISQYENYISIDVKTISEETKMSPVSVNRALKELKQYNVISIFKHTSDRRRNDYFINPLASWRGSGMERVKRINKLKKENKQLEFFQ